MMTKAIELAKAARGCLLPNPRVGAIIAWKDKIVGQGLHQGPGTPHAEVMAIIDARRNGFRKFDEAELFVNLEPCAHQNKRTPPCAPLVIETKFQKVHIAHPDPNPEVNGRGIRALQKAGVKTIVGENREEALAINQAFIKNQTKKEPYLRLKLAMTYDGKMAHSSGKSKWITSPASRVRVHELRAEASAILTTFATVVADKPHLTVRLKDFKSAPTILVWSNSKISTQKVRSHFKNRELLFPNPKESLKKFLKRAFKELEIADIFVEAGPRMASVLLKEKLVDELHIFFGRGFLGGKGRYSIGHDWQPKSLNDSLSFKPENAEIIGPDLYLRSILKKYKA